MSAMMFRKSIRLAERNGLKWGCPSLFFLQREGKVGGRKGKPSG